MTITLAKALKHRKRIAEQIAKIEASVMVYNSTMVGAEREVDAKALVARRDQLVIDLIATKIAIADGGAPIRGKILSISEAKGKIAFLTKIDTKHGKQETYGDREIVYEAQIRANDVAQMVAQLEKNIDATQEEIDAFNYKTMVEVPDAE